MQEITNTDESIKKKRKIDATGGVSGYIKEDCD